MLLELLPVQLYDLVNINILFRRNGSAIIHKSLSENLMDKEIYLSSVAILFVVKGRQVIKNYDGKSVVVEQGQLVYLSKDMYLVSDFVTEKGEFEAVIFFLSDEFIKNKSRNEYVSDKSNNYIPTLQSSIQIKKYIESLLSVYLNFNNNDEIVDLKLFELLALIKSQKDGMQFLSRFDSFLLPKKRHDIREFMKNNYLKNLKVEDYALLTGRSKSTFIREFKKLYNNTPNQWLIEQRLEKAHQMLTSSDYNITTTAFEVGYENVSHFISAYKKRFNITPNQAKKGTLTQISY